MQVRDKFLVKRAMDSGSANVPTEKKAKSDVAPGPALLSESGLKFPSKSPKSIFNLFQQGDLVFGLLRVRNPVADELIKNNYTNVVANDLNGSVVEDVIKDSTSSTLSTARKRHFKFLKRYVNYLRKRPSKPIPNIKDDPVVSGAYRRACKLLLINREFDRNYKTHVVTQRINWERLFDKKDDGVTNSEIRAAYRDFKKHGRNPFVLFYDLNNELMSEAPWEKKEIAPYFEAYDKARAEKKIK